MLYLGKTWSISGKTLSFLALWTAEGELQGALLALARTEAVMLLRMEARAGRSESTEGRGVL